jgi:hypothetical protein
VTDSLPSGHSFDPRSGPRSRVYLDGIWGFHLRPAPTAGLVWWPARAQEPPAAVHGAFVVLVGEPLHFFIMQARQFHNLRTRVGAQA